jgi:GT2 family glycosyltransferase
VPPVASVIVPTRSRPDYLEVALASAAPQVAAAGAELIVIDDGAEAPVRALAERHGARYLFHPEPRGLNAARNTGIESAGGELLVFIDDDVQVEPGWLEALVAAASGCPDHECFGGPIRARLEGTRMRLCDREGPPVTALDLGPQDRDAEFVWGANLTIRRSAFARIGPFDPALDLYGDEHDWQLRLRAAGGRIRYVAGAGLWHRRAGADAKLGPLMRAQRFRGRNLRRYDAVRGETPTLARELRVLAGCVAHGPRYLCANGPIMAAHSFGRVEEALRPGPNPRDPDFLSGRSGTVGGRRGALLGVSDALLDAELSVSGRRRGLAERAAAAPRRRVLVAAVDRPDGPGLLAAALGELARSRHDLTLAVAPSPEGHGKWENLNRLIAGHDTGNFDWLLILDDDVELPRGFLDGFLAAAEALDLVLAQPAQRRRSHAAWPVTRRIGRSLARETAFVEIGPVTALHRRAFETLLPFPDLRMGWGLDAHWAAVARDRGWRLGIVDALPVSHLVAPVASAYRHDEAIAEAADFLASRDYVPRDTANRTLHVHRRLPAA